MTIDLHTLSGAYVLHALSTDEAEEFRLHLDECPACRDEVRELQEAAATMCASEAIAPPPALRARVLAAADHQAQLPPKVTSIEQGRRRRIPARIAAAVAAVVLVAVGAVGVAISQSSHDNPSVVPQAVTQVFDAPDAHTATVDTSNGGKVTVATSQQLGRMAVQTRGLPKLSDKRVYQMWAIHNGTPTSAGVVRDLATGAAMAMPAAGTTVAITIEPDGGSEQPTSKPIVSMDPSSV